MIHRSHKIRLVPNKEQAQMLVKACGCARYAWNWALAEWDKEFKAGNKPNAFALKKQWNAVKPDWVYESPKDANQYPFEALGKAFSAFFRGQARHPVFKKKGVADCFHVNNDKFNCDAAWVTLPKIGKVRMREQLRFPGRILGAAISCRAGRWYLAVSVELPDIAPGTGRTSTVGVDAGIKDIGVASDGTKCPNPKVLKKYAGKLAHEQKALSRKKKGSNNSLKQMVKLQRVHDRIASVRNDAIHKFTAELAKNHGTAVIETLDIVQMLEGARWLRILLQDTAMREMHRQLAYKMTVVKAPRFYASSKTCSGCGNKKAELPLSERTYVCDICALRIDRDFNAAVNLKQMRWATPCMPVEW